VPWSVTAGRDRWPDYPPSWPAWATTAGSGREARCGPGPDPFSPNQLPNGAGCQHHLTAVTLDRCYLPGTLRDHPRAVVPYLVIRDRFAARLYHQRTGYWHPDGHDLHPFTTAEQAAALGLLAGGKEEPFITAAATLTRQGDHALALHIIQAGRACHPASTALAQLRQTVLHRLMDADQQLVPFRFAIYAELAGTEIGPVT
jgi:hypothetical protein